MRLVIFGFGYSAAHFVRTRGGAHELVATVTTQDKAERLREQGIDAHLFDGTNFDSDLPAAVERAEAILVSIPPDPDDPVLAHFAGHIERSGARIVYLSTIGVYGDHGGAWIDETTPPRPVSARSRHRLAAEDGWRALGARAGNVVHILRLAGIYGPGRGPFERVANGTARNIVKPGQVFNRIHVEDISRAIEAALAHERGGIWNVTDDEPAPPQDVLAYAAALLGVPPPPDIPFETADMTPMARSFYGENKRVSNARLRIELGVTLACPTYREGLRSIHEGR